MSQNTVSIIIVGVAIALLIGTLAGMNFPIGANNASPTSSPTQPQSDSSTPTQLATEIPTPTSSPTVTASPKAKKAVSALW